MKFKAIVYQNNPKKIHGHLERINLFGLQYDYVLKRRKKMKKQERIESAQKRIQELKTLIDHWLKNERKK